MILPSVFNLVKSLSKDFAYVDKKGIIKGLITYKDIMKKKYQGRIY